MFDSDHKLRHLPFFEELATKEEGSAEWRAATAGLVVLRLADSWIDDGPRVALADAWGVAHVRTAVDALSDQPHLCSILHRVLDVVEQSSAADVSSLAPRLMAYGQVLEYEARWGLAMDVYETLVAHTHPVQSPDIAAHAHLRRGYCLRQVGNLTESLEAYRTAGEVARAANDLVGVLRARIGEAKAAASRGNLPRAQEILDDTVAQAAANDLTEVHSMALHDRAMVAHVSGDYELAIKLAYQALDTTQSPRERDRLLGDIATSLHQLGVRSGARDAYLILAATGQEQYARWFATLNLMELAAEDGEQILFESYRRSLDATGLPPRLRVQFWMTSGVGYEQFGRSDLAETMLERALAVAEENDLNQLAFEVEQAMLARKREGIRVKAAVSEYQSGDAVRIVLEQLRKTREHVGT